MLQRTPGTFYVLTYHRGPAPLNTALGLHTNHMREFAIFAQQTRDTMVFCADDVRLAELFARKPGAISYGFHPLANYRLVIPGRVRLPPNPDLSGVEVGSAGASPSHDSAACRLAPRVSFEVWHAGQKLGDFSVRLIGEKNV